MARVSWIQDDIYIVILDGEDKRQLANRSNKDCAASRFLARTIESGLTLAERVDDKDSKQKDDEK